MKKHALTIILLIIISFSCSNNESEKDTTTSTIDYSALSKSVDNQVIIFGKIIADSNNGEKFTKYFKTEPLNLNSSKSAPKEKTIKIKLAPHYNKKENKFMLSFYEDLANSYDNQIIELLNSKKTLLNNSNFSTDFKNEVNFIFNTIEKTANEINTILNKSQTNQTAKNNDFTDCMAKQGKNIGRAIATGAIVGAARGAIIGASGGTVALPGVGTIAGAVNGAVYGAASGAVGSGATALVWAFIDCAMERKYLEATSLYTEDFYNDIILPNNPDLVDFYNFEDYDELTNRILFIPTETLIKFIE